MPNKVCSKRSTCAGRTSLGKRCKNPPSCMKGCDRFCYRHSPTWVRGEHQCVPPVFKPKLEKYAKTLKHQQQQGSLKSKSKSGSRVVLSEVYNGQDVVKDGSSSTVSLQFLVNILFQIMETYAYRYQLGRTRKLH
jgi:hypothetical protein